MQYTNNACDQRSQKSTKFGNPPKLALLNKNDYLAVFAYRSRTWQSDRDDTFAGVRYRHMPNAVSRLAGRNRYSARPALIRNFCVQNLIRREPHG